MKNLSPLNRQLLATIIAAATTVITSKTALADTTPIDVPNGTFDVVNNPQPAPAPFVLTDSASGYVYSSGFGTQFFGYSGATGPHSGDLPDWTSGGGQTGVQILGTNYVNTPDPTLSSGLYGYVAGGSISQTLTTDYQADTDYTLTYSAANRLGGDPGSDFTANLYAGTTLLASASPELVPGPSGAGGGTFRQYTLSYDYLADPAGTAGDPLEISFANSSGTQALVDNVSLTETTGTPEPSSTVLLLVGVGAAACLDRARRIRQS